jgi:hypothetical protein
MVAFVSVVPQKLMATTQVQSDWQLLVTHACLFFCVWRFHPTRISAVARMRIITSHRILIIVPHITHLVAARSHTPHHTMHHIRGVLDCSIVRAKLHASGKTRWSGFFKVEHHKICRSRVVGVHGKRYFSWNCKSMAWCRSNWYMVYPVIPPKNGRITQPHLDNRPESGLGAVRPLTTFGPTLSRLLCWTGKKSEKSNLISDHLWRRQTSIRLTVGGGGWQRSLTFYFS